MAQFEHTNARYTIIDASSRQVVLTAQEADDLFQWLYDMRDNLAEQTRSWEYTPPDALRSLLSDAAQQLL